MLTLLILTVFNLFVLLQATDAGTPWWDYPGLEVWKFFNLIVFILAAFYFHRFIGRPVREGLRSRSEAIKRELKRAQEERDQALAKLHEVEARLATLDDELSKVRERTAAEIETERERISALTESELARMRDQAAREIESTGKTVRHELRRFAAQESIRLAEELLRERIGPAEQARLTNRSIEELRGSAR